jgi:FkbM family methyltransferase
VFAIGPNPAMYASLRSAVERNRLTTVRAEAIALGDSEGQLRRYLPPPSESRPHNVTSLPQPGWAPCDVPCRRLDDCLAAWKLPPIDLMKMDVEGSDPASSPAGAMPWPPGRSDTLSSRSMDRACPRRGAVHAGS